MTNANSRDLDKKIELLEKLLAVQLYSMGTPQGRIASIVGKSKTWVNELLRGVPKVSRIAD